MNPDFLSSEILFRRTVLGRCFTFIIALNSFTLAMKTSFYGLKHCRDRFKTKFLLADWTMFLRSNRF